MLSFLKSVLSFSKPQLNFQSIKMSRILFSINLNFGCSSYPQFFRCHESCQLDFRMLSTGPTPTLERTSSHSGPPAREAPWSALVVSLWKSLRIPTGRKNKKITEIITCLINLKPQFIGTYRKIYGIIAGLRKSHHTHDTVRIGFVAKPPASLAFRNLLGAPQHQCW